MVDDGIQLIEPGLIHSIVAEDTELFSGDGQHVFSQVGSVDLAATDKIGAGVVDAGIQSAISRDISAGLHRGSDASRLIRHQGADKAFVLGDSHAN